MVHDAYSVPCTCQDKGERVGSREGGRESKGG